MPSNIGCEAALKQIQNKNFLRGFPPDGCYLVGVSGGRDSVALLHSLLERGYRKLIICHLNHQLRGRSSAADARFVARFVSKYRRQIVGQALRLPLARAGKRGACPTTTFDDVDVEIGTANVRELAAKQKISVEAAAREARYQFFAQVAKRRRCRAIFLAHHADDLVETFLINLFRGSGATGLGAIREVSKRQVEDVDLTIVRPLLGVWRREIDDYVRKHRLKFREDASNKDLAPLRNRIRRQVIPYLEKKLGRNIRQSIWRAAVIAVEEENWIEDQLPDATDVDVSVAKLRELPVALQRREILKWLRTRKITNVGFDVVENVRSLLNHDAPVAKVNLPQDRHVRRRAGRIFIE
ncbi:MAG TPA: tRNA lysidine(34) synthetase TilS [Chthoniobacterales bacterium]|nr:tRNA lysidine(34) synthetase TilS [Chthoniobacterales bacterium]